MSRDDPRAARPIGIVTNGPTEVQHAKLELLGIDRLVDFVLVSEEFGVAKPDPAIFREALRLAGVRPEEAIFVGDSVEFDMAGARAAGIPTIWLNRQQRPWTELGPPPTREIRSLADLPLRAAWRRDMRTSRADVLGERLEMLDSPLRTLW